MKISANRLFPSVKHFIKPTETYHLGFHSIYYNNKSQQNKQNKLINKRKLALPTQDNP